METIAYQGFLRIEENEEGTDVLYLSGDSEPLARRLEERLSRRFATVRYYIADKEATMEEAQEAHLRELFGEVRADYRMHYSELSGYLWTDEDIKVGGHDLLGELKGFAGKYLILLIDTDNEQEREREREQKKRRFKSCLEQIERLNQEMDGIAAALGVSREELIRESLLGKRK